VYGAQVRDLVSAAFRPRTSPPSVATVLRSILWPLAILLIIHRSYVLATNGYITDDYGPVYRAVSNFRRGWDIYNEHLNYVDPHYLYPPGGTLLMAPFGYLPVDASRWWFESINCAAIIIAAYLLIRLFGYTFSSVAYPAVLVAMFCTESVVNTLVFGNINGCVLLLEVLFFRWILDGKVSHQWWAGVAIGLSLVVKPVLAPLLLLPLLNRQWRAVVTAIAVPVVFNLAAWPLVADPMNFITRTLPYIFSIRDYFNSSIQGNGVYYGLPMWLILLLRIVFALLAVVAIWLLYRYYRTRDPLFWFTTSSGVLLIASWVAVYGFMSADKWLMWHWPTTGRALEYLRVTYGWCLMLIVVSCVLYFRYLDAKAEGRLDDGIDPQWMKDVPPRQPVPA
jgi:arabinofuranan 3-O-arabinosyltransferase